MFSFMMRLREFLLLEAVLKPITAPQLLGAEVDASSPGLDGQVRVFRCSAFILAPYELIKFYNRILYLSRTGKFLTNTSLPISLNCLTRLSAPRGSATALNFLKVSALKNVAADIEVSPSSNEVPIGVRNI